MTKNQFIGHCFCDMRFNKLLWHIEHNPIPEVEQMYKIHQTMPNNHRYTDLQKAFDERLNK